ncbi:hypothetical protein J1N35_035571 [Gossypium stocksii]|uniref:C2H2-type domain-containing protein n=1 Tax=Gossypium stocksii TaxID=47602 RepID=A0A9D3UUI8_9ROSI|nr:hypothetical protein J1N35_035571 [Gossypium stocksii]
MAGPTHQRKPSKDTYHNQKKKRRPQPQPQPQKNDKPPSNWSLVKGLFFGKPPQQQQHQQQQQQQQQQQREHVVVDETGKKCKKMRCSGSLCSNTKIMERPVTASPELNKKRASLGSVKAPVQHEPNGVVVSSSNVGSFRGLPFTRFSGCYECRMVVDPVLGMAKDPSLRTTIRSCPECGEIFMKAENLELHQAVRHAVSELGPEDTSKNIVEIIFQSSWLKKQAPICQIDRILKVHNTPKTISKFEEYRDSIKSKATKHPKKHPRCIADGNELLRFHCTTFACSLGLNGSSNLCNSSPNCNVCSIIKNGFKVAQELGNGGVPNGKGILTTATSGKAHDMAAGVEEDNGKQEKRAMLVCRVIAGRVKKNMEGSLEDYDSVTVAGGDVGAYSNLDELYVFNPKAILPCFVVIYRGF